MTNMKLRLLCTNSTKGSASLKLLAATLTDRLGYKVWRSIISKSNRDNIKYGHSVDKLVQYNWFKDQNIPALEFTQDRGVVLEWLAAGFTCFGRRLLSSSCGKGIVVLEPDTTQVEQCPVYTKYKKKKREFRVHVFKNQVVSVCEKKRRKDFDGERDTKIRNLANGYVFVQAVSNEPAGLRELALQAAQISPSDFRGVDIGYNEKADELFVIEVNSAPGIQGSNVNKYVEGILSA